MSSSSKGARLTKTAGWITAAFGTVHLTVATLVNRRSTWSAAIGDGWWNTFQLDPSTAAEFERSEGFWFTAGSFGVPMIVLGCYIVSSANHQRRVPEWLGWVLGSWGVVVATTLPGSPGWMLPVIGGLIVAGDRSSMSATPGTGHDENGQDRRRRTDAHAPEAA